MKYETLPVPITEHPDGTIDIEMPEVVGTMVEAHILLEQILEWGRLPAYLRNPTIDLLRRTHMLIDDHWLH